MWPLPVPTSEKEPRVPGPLPKAEALLALYVELGLAKFGCVNGKLLPSRRSSKRARSWICHHLASDSLRPVQARALERVAAEVARV